MADKPETFEARIAGFRWMYERVSTRFEIYSRRFRHELAQWLMRLVAGFEQEYQAWRSDPKILSYLDEVDRAGKSWRASRLIAHACLHILYDLPRVIAVSLDELPASVTEWEARRLFYSLNNDFRDLFQEMSTAGEVMGQLRFIGRFMRLQGDDGRALIGVLSNWIVALRTTAWIHAEYLRNGPGTRQAREQWLWDNFSLHAAGIFRRHRRPWQWMDQFARFSLDTESLLSVPISETTSSDLAVGTSEQPDELDEFL